MRILSCIAILGMFLFASQLPAQNQPKALTNDDIVKLLKSGMDESLIKTVIQHAPSTKFDISTDGLIALKTAGVPQSVIATMVTGSIPPEPPKPDVSRGAKVEEPEYANTVFLLDTNGTLRPLERQEPRSAMKLKALGYGGGRGVLVITGARSPVRLASDTKPQFIVRMSAGDLDPSTMIQFLALNSTKNTREIQTVKVGPMGLGGGKVTSNDSAVAFTIAKYGETSFKITPTKPLEPGEYGLGTKTVAYGFCFGVDAK